MSPCPCLSAPFLLTAVRPRPPRRADAHPHHAAGRRHPGGRAADRHPRRGHREQARFRRAACRADQRVDVTARNILDPGVGGERGAGGTGATAAGAPAAAPCRRGADQHDELPAARLHGSTKPGELAIEARTGDGAQATVRLPVEAWSGAGSAPRARNIILFLGDGMGAAHRTAARIVSRGVEQRAREGAPRDGYARRHRPGDDGRAQLRHHRLVAGACRRTPPARRRTTTRRACFPTTRPTPSTTRAVEYIGELLRRTRGAGFNVGIVTNRRRDGLDARPQRRLHAGPLRRRRHRRAVLRRTRDERRQRC
jgi:hypothetical protein